MILISTLRLEAKILASFLLVDGIYLELTWFLKLFQKLVGKSKVYFSKGQEGDHKDIEQAFGVLQHNFQNLTCLFEQCALPDIHDMDMTNVILHNAMVAVQKIQNEESNGFMNFWKLLT